MVLSVLLLTCFATLSFSPDPLLIKQALKTFKTMRSVYLDVGIPASEIDSRADNFVRNYIRYVELDKIDGKTFTASLNSIALLDDSELEKMFGVVPDINSYRADSPSGSENRRSPLTLEKIKQDIGEDQFNLASLVFNRLRLHYKDHGINHDNVRERRIQFMRGYFKKYHESIEGGDLEKIATRIASDPEVEDLLGEKEIDRKILIDENLSDKTKEELKVPDGKRAGAHEKNLRTDSLGAWLTTSQYNSATVQMCKQEIASKSCAVNRDVLGARDFDGSLQSCQGVSMKFRCLNNTQGIPGEFRDWEELGYVRSLLHYRSATTMPAGWAHTASQIMDMYQQIYASNVTYHRRDLTDLIHLLNCVYERNGLGRGSPQAAFQYISDRHVIPKFPSTAPANCRETSDDCSQNPYKDNKDDILNEKSGDIFYKYLYLWDKSRKGRENEFCRDSAVFEPSKSSIPNVSFLTGKAYVQFADHSYVEVWTESASSTSFTEKNFVYGEEIAKPLLYKKGPLAVMMSACYEMFLTRDGIFNYDCSLSTRRYLPQWVTIVSYGTNWFGIVMPRVYGVGKTYGVDYPSVLRVSRKVDYTFKWNSFVLPRVNPYENTLNCKNGGISLLEGKCYCPTNKYGKRCNLDCNITCKNGGRPSHGGCKCECDGSSYGKHCGKKCSCKNSGMCDGTGNCICHRQTSWGSQCENTCSCQNNGYCHQDGSCECIGGFAGATCTETCTKRCAYPKVCLYSNALTESGDLIREYCGCPHGFYGAGCLSRVDCQRADRQNSALCSELISRSRCNTDQAMEMCPHACGHCLTLNVVTEFDL